MPQTGFCIRVVLPPLRTPGVPPAASPDSGPTPSRNGESELTKERLTYTLAEAAKAIGVSPVTIYRLIIRGALRPIYVTSKGRMNPVESDSIFRSFFPTATRSE
jgi:hypothetical protein